MKKIFFILLLFFTLLYSDNAVDITPPTLANMNHYDKLLKQNNNNYNKDTTTIFKYNNNNNAQIIVKNKINKNNTITTNKNTNEKKDNSNVTKSSLNNNTPKVIFNPTHKKTIYNNIIYSNVLDSNEKGKYCHYMEKGILEKIYELGYKKGIINSKWEIQQWMKKMGKYFNNIFRIKDYYIEGILEPPFVIFNNKNEITNNGKTFIKKEGEYIITKPAKFKIPLKWQDFLLEKHLKKPDYTFKYYYYIDKKNCKISNNKIKKYFLKGYKEAKNEIVILYKHRLIKLQKYIKKLYTYQRLYLTRKIRPPVITPIITPIKTTKNKMIISKEEYTIVKRATFDPIFRDWKNYLIKSVNEHTINLRK